MLSAFTMTRICNTGKAILDSRWFHLSMLLDKKKPLKPPPKNFMEFPVKGSIQYVARQISDPYVKKRHTEGYRCRSIYKLKEMDETHRIFKQGMTVVDIGAAPGSWSQAAAEKIYRYSDDGMPIFTSPGKIIAVDLLRFTPMEGVTQILGDVTNRIVQMKVIDELKGVKEENDIRKADVVMCDAAPKASGHKSQDHIILIQLIIQLSKFSLQILKPGGTYLFKLWDGSETEKLRKSLQRYFKTVKNVKPPASRDESSEFYVLCQKFKPL
ncbi:unnamed protein product [Clavelina lepadiformis]|uniref:rRNA methyltransferase 2, mitochondrial n=1 Tax=Clavelina lepadiformis TaxID=159417 RepID=A0ABP0FS00_CLALP